jgi:hypothetical protein
MTMLRTPPRSLDLKAFGIVVSLLAAIIAGVAALTARGPGAGLSLAGIVGLALAAAALLRPGVFRSAYQIWADIQRFVTRAARFYVLGIVFGLLWLLSLAGARVVRRPTSEQLSGWIPRHGDSRTAYESQARIALDVDERSHWSAILKSWSTRSGNGWVAGLLPFLGLLAALDPSGKRSFSSSNYTLY